MAVKMDRWCFLLDVDGVFTNGTFTYSQSGKINKVFGSHDFDGLKSVADWLDIKCISADKRGFSISKKRITDIGLRLNLVSEIDRTSYIARNFNLEKLIFMGDGLHDVPTLANAKISFAPSNAVMEAELSALFVTTKSGGDGAVYEACSILNKMKKRGLLNA